MADIFKKKYGSNKAGDKKHRVDLPYSKEYKKFREAETSTAYSFYEGLCNFAEKIYSPKLGKKEAQSLNNTIYLTHLDVTPASVYSLTYIVTLLVAVIGIAVGVWLMSLLAFILVLVAVLLTFVGLRKIPNIMLQRWRAKASDQLILVVLYLIIELKRGSNLERGVHFVSRQLGPPISLDLLRVLWQFQSGEYSTVKEALDAYTVVWKDSEGEFVQSIQLIESSLAQSKESKKRTLDKATEVILQGIQDHMTHFAQKLQNPVRALHMLGIILPVLGLVLLPMVTSFMDVSPVYLFVFFDFAIPITVYVLARNIMKARPGGISFEKEKIYQEVGSSKASALLLALLTFGAFGALGYFYYSISPESFTKYSNYSFYLSLIGVAAVGFSIAVYLWVSNRKLIKLKRKITSMEKEFSSAIFQLGSRIREGSPPELAFGKVAKTTEGMKIQEFFRMVDYNLRTKNMSLRRAIFDKRSGAARYFPSNLIRNVMQILVEGAKKSLKAAASSLIILSKYLRNLHRVYERLKDLLADTIASMKMQATFFVSVITAVVVGLSTLIVRVLSALDDVMRGGMTGMEVNEAEATTQFGAIGNIADVLNVGNAMPAWQFQIMVGLYVILIVVLLSYVLALVIHGSDKIERKYLIAKNLFISMMVYIIGVLVVFLILNKVAGGIVEGIAV